MGRILERLRNHPFALLVLACASLYYLPLDWRALWDPAESDLAEMAREMWQSSHWTIPHLHNLPQPDQPPVGIWLTAVAIGLFGAHEWVVRLIPATFGLLTVWITYRLGARWQNQRVGLISAALLATSFLFFAFTQYATADMVFTFWMTLALFAGCNLLVERSVVRARRFSYVISFALAAGVLTKSWMGVLLVVVFTGVALTRPRRLSAPPVPWKLAVLLFFALTLPWYAAVAFQGSPAFFQVRSETARPFYFYLPVLLVGFMPWTIFLPKLGARWFGHRHAAFQRDSEGAVLLAWACVVLVFCSLLPNKPVGEILSAFPALALLVGNELEDTLAETEDFNRPAWISGALAGMIFLLIAFLLFLKRPETITFLSPAWHKVLAQSDQLAIVLGLGVFILVGVWGMRQSWVSIGGLIVVQVLILTSASSLAPELDAVYSTRHFVRQLQVNVPAGEPVVAYGIAAADVPPSLPFYWGSVIPHDSEAALSTLRSGSWGITDPSHWEAFTRTAPTGQFQRMAENPNVVLFRKEH